MHRAGKVNEYWKTIRDGVVSCCGVFQGDFRDAFSTQSNIIVEAFYEDR